jgi:iron complex outermembrane receptor protein
MDYQITRDILAYGGYRHGYKRGGFNARGGDLAEFGPEKVDDYFIGVKSAFRVAGHRATFNIEGFWDDYRGAQRVYLDLSAGALVSSIQNVPKLRYRGFDTDLDLNLTNWFRLSVNYTFVDAKYIRYPDNTVATALALLAAGGAPQAFIDTFAASHPLSNNRLSANPPAFNSRHKLNVQGRLHYNLDGGIEIAFLPSLSYQSRYILQDNSAVLPAIGEVLFNGGIPVSAIADGANIAPGYMTADARLEFNNIASRFDLSFNVTNVTNKTYVIGGNALWQFGINALAYGAPRMYYVEARYRF